MATETMTKTPESQVAAQHERTRSGLTFRPNVDIAEAEDELTVYADMPGVDGQSIEIHFENGTLSIHGRIADRQIDGTNFLLREYGVRRLLSSF